MDEIGKEELYELTWPGKSKAQKVALTPSLCTMQPCKEESVDWDTTENMFIEGDNLDALKLMQKDYAGKVKMIYIDPPYNTGKKLVYNDKFKETLRDYLKRTGRKTTSKHESSGRYHANWLNMMYPRLKLARNLLKNDGVIFISIDDHEVTNLRKICDEIFGEENFFASIAWQSRTSVQNDTDISEQHEYLVGYAKKRRIEQRRLNEKNKNIWYKLSDFAAYPLLLDKSIFSNPDNDIRGLWKADPFDAPNIRPNLTYAISNPNTGKKYWPPAGRHWRTDQNSYKKLFLDNRIIFGKTGQSSPQLKVFYKEKKEFGKVNRTWWDGNAFGTSTNGTKELQGLFNSTCPFTFPKPTSVINSLMNLSIRNNDLIMDFFSGSSTTAHATLKLNKEDSGSRKFIMVQLPELTNEKSEAFKAGYKNIADIGKERIRRVGKKIKEEDSNYKGDLGFKVFKLVKGDSNDKAD